MSTSYGLIIKVSRNENLQKYRILLSQHTNYLHKWLLHVNFDIFAAANVCFSARLVNMCKPRAIFCFLLLAYLDWHFMEVEEQAYQAGWGWWMQVGSVPCDQKFSYKWNLSLFKIAPTKQADFLPGQPASYNQLLIYPVLHVPECYLA